MKKFELTEEELITIMTDTYRYGFKSASEYMLYKIPTPKSDEVVKKMSDRIHFGVELPCKIIDIKK